VGTKKNFTPYKHKALTLATKERMMHLINGSDEAYGQAIIAVNQLINYAGNYQWIAEGGKRYNKKEAAEYILTEWAKLCTETNVKFVTNLDSINKALKEKASTWTQLKRDMDHGEPVDPASFFDDLVDKLIEHMPEYAGPRSILGAMNEPKNIADFRKRGPTDLYQIRENWRVFFKRNKKFFTKEAQATEYFTSGIERVRKDLLAIFTEKLAEKVRYNGGTYERFCELANKLLSTIFLDYSAVSDDDKKLYCAALYQYLWQVKRNLYGWKTQNEIFLVIFGKQRCGKDEFIKAMLGKHLDEWRYNWSGISAISDIEKHGRFASYYLVGYVQEMGDVPSKHRFSIVKSAITDEGLDQRVYHSQDSMFLWRRTSFISASNVPLVSISPDSTGMGRFIEISCDMTEEYRMENRDTTEHVRDYFREHESLEFMQLVNEEEKETIFRRDDYLASLLQKHQQSLRPLSDLEKVLEVLGLTAFEGSKKTTILQVYNAWKDQHANKMVDDRPPALMNLRAIFKGMGIAVHGTGRDFYVNLEPIETGRSSSSGTIHATPGSGESVLEARNGVRGSEGGSAQERGTGEESDDEFWSVG